MSAKKRTNTESKSTSKTAKKPAKKAVSKAASSKKSTRTPAKKTSSKKASGKKASVKRTPAKKAASKKTVAKKATAKRPSTKKPTAKKASAKKPAKKAVAKKPLKKAAPKKKPVAKKAAVAKKKPVATKAAVAKKRPAAKKATVKKRPAAKPASSAKKPAKKTARKTAAKKPAAPSRATKTSRTAGKPAAAQAKAKTGSKSATSSKAPSSKAGARPAKALIASSAKKKKVRPIETEADASKRAVKGKITSRPAKTTRTTKKSSRSKSKARPKGKTADGRQPGQAMRVPPPVTDVLITSDLPDVRRAQVAADRQEGARGHLTPDSSAAGARLADWEEPVNASLMMSALAADASPKIEDNYDYSVLEDFEASEWCPRPTRMVNTACGGGEASVHFAKRGFRCVGIDSDRSQIGLARERAWLAGVDIDFMVGDLFETPNLLPAESFGLAIDRGGFSLLEGSRERQRYLSNIRRLLFQGGVFLLSAGFFPIEEDSKRSRKNAKESKLLLAREGGVVVNELAQGGFNLLHRVLRPTQDSGDLAELFLYLRKP